MIEEILLKHHLPYPQWVDEETTKNTIVLHHTVSNGWSGDPDGAESVTKWWNSDPRRVGTHFIIGKHGRIIRCIPEANWAWHVGKTEIDKRSFGIELVNVGYLVQGKGGLYWNGMADNPSYKWMSEYEILKESYRGLKFFAPYTDAQMKSLGWLCAYLGEKYGIKMKLPLSGLHELIRENVTGIISHANIIYQKTDISPVFDSKLLLRYIHENTTESIAE